jgi:DNA polymerase III subunit delta'
MSTPPAGVALELGGDPFDAVIGQPAALRQLRAAVTSPVHAYLLVGPAGSGKRQAATALAGELVAHGGGEGAADVQAVARHRRLAAAEAHPDISYIEREGPFITRDQARAVVTQSVRSPMEGARQVLVLCEFHLVSDAAPVLLKAVEEPPASTVFLILAEEITPELVTIASRCVVIRFGALDPAAVADRLVVEGIASDVAHRAAAASGGDLRRARILAADADLSGRMALWAALPDRLNGHGATVVAAAEELLASLERSLEAIDERHRTELEELSAFQERYGLRASTRPTVERHRRERRRFRMDELRFGLGVLSRAYRDRVVARLGGGPDPAGGTGGANSVGSAVELTAFDAIVAATESLERNPNERLVLIRLLTRLAPLR